MRNSLLTSPKRRGNIRAARLGKMKRTAAAGLGALLLGLLILPLSLYRDRTPVGRERSAPASFAEKPEPLPPIQAAIRPSPPDGRERDAVIEEEPAAPVARRPFPRPRRVQPRRAARKTAARPAAPAPEVLGPAPLFGRAERLYAEEFYSAALKHYEASLRDELPLLGAARRRQARARVRELRAKLKLR